MDRLEQILMEAYATIRANQDSSHEAVDPVLADAMRKYATEVARHNLERAANQAQMSYHDGHYKTNSRIKYFQSGADHLVVDKESITSLEIELI